MTTRDPALADPVTHAEFNEELNRLRDAVLLLANCVGVHVISQHNAQHLLALLLRPGER